MDFLRRESLYPVGGLVLAAVLATVVLTACRNESSSDLVRSALEYQAKGDHKAAIIQLKNAVQKQPENGEARLLLGKSSLAVGDFATAEKEFRKAAEFGQPTNVVAPLLAQALLDSGEPGMVVTEFGQQHLSESSAEASLRVIVGHALVRLGKVDDAAASFKAALAVDPANVPAQLAQAQLAIMEGKMDAAVAMVDQIVAKNPQSADALLLQGDLRLLRGDRTGGREALERAVAAEPGKVPARLELIAMLIAERDFDAATAQIAAARSVRPGDLRLVYFEALIAAQQKDFTKARDLTQQVLKRAPEHVPTLVLAGAVEMQDKKPVAAEAYLQKAVSLAPQHDGARKLLVRTYMASNQPALALEAAKPLEAKGAQLDAPTLMLVGEAYLANGNVRQASSFYAAAAESKPHETAARVRLGQIAMVSGDPERGIRELEAATAMEGAPAQADLELIIGYMRRGETAKALEAAKSLVKKRPDDPMAYQILGTVNLARKDAAAARAAYGKVLELNPTYLPAVSGLARLDFADNKPADARARFESVVAKEPNNELALLGLAEVMSAMRTPAPEIVQVLQRAIAAKPQSAAARVALVNLYLQERDTRAALLAAQEASAALRDDARVLDALGRAQAAAGETNQAIETFNRLAAAQPQSPLPLLRLASIYGARNETDKAIDTLLRAQKVAPANTDIGRDLVRGYLAMGKGDDALKQAKALQAAVPASAVGHVLEGDVYGATRQWGEAERAYRAGLKVDPAFEEAALKLHGVLMAAGRKADADAAARKWLSEHPQDVMYRSYLAEQALRMRDLKSAIAQYQLVIAQQPNNVAALNNLAWAAGQLGDAKAMSYAERALKLAPNNAAVLDTAGVLLVSAGDTAKGLEYLTRAVSIAPERMDIRFNLAKALIKAGRTEDARRELTQLQGATGEFAGKAEIPALLKQLK